MRLVVTTEAHLREYKGTILSENGTRAYKFWTRYLAVFDSVTVVARVSSTNKSEGLPVEGPGVRVAPLPGYVGPMQYLANIKNIKERIRQVVEPGSSTILRTGPIGDLVWSELKRLKRPYGMEVVGDPYDVYAPGAVKTPFRPILRWWSPRQLRKQCAHACAVAYVTERALQRRYPPSPYAFTTHYSSIDLPTSALASIPRKFPEYKAEFTLITVGTLAQLYKATDVLIEACVLCIEKGMNIRLLVVGDGKYRKSLEARVVELGIENRVHFLGQLPGGHAVYDMLDKADLFVLPSRQEGLPRAMIEAMARGLPCIGSTVGGIPELIAPEDLVPPNNVGALAMKICEVLNDPQRMNRMAARNLKKAGEYTEDVLKDRRRAFYEFVKTYTAQVNGVPR